MSFDKEALEALVREVVKETLQGPAPKAPPATTSDPGCADEVCAPYTPRPARVADAAALRAIKAATPARLGQGRSGTRYTTEVAITLRAEHAIALDAVNSAVPESFAAQLGCVPLRTRAKDHEEFLLFPDQGRRLDDESRERLLKEGTSGVDVQVIAGDGLSALALMQQGPTLLPALQAALHAEGFSTGKPLFVRYARIGVQDEIGVLLRARSTVILVGERPGLGTGDSLSLYTAYAPRLNQDNAEKNCMSNVREMGFPPAEAAVECARLMRRTFDAGGGGVHLVRPVRDITRRAAV